MEDMKKLSVVVVIDNYERMEGGGGRTVEARGSSHRYPIDQHSVMIVFGSVKSREQKKRKEEEKRK